MSGKKTKKKKEKVVYYDDGRTIADMSNVSGPWRPSRLSSGRPGRGREIWKTYWGAVRMMLGPMLAVIVAIIILYMILTVVFTFFG